MLKLEGFDTNLMARVKIYIDADGQPAIRTHLPMFRMVGVGEDVFGSRGVLPGEEPEMETISGGCISIIKSGTGSGLHETITKLKLRLLCLNAPAGTYAVTDRRAVASPQVKELEYHKRFNSKNI